MADNLDSIFKSTDEIRRIAQNLYNLAVSLEVTGNMILSDKMCATADSLMSCQKRITSSVSSLLREEAQQANTRVGEVFTKLAKEE